MGAPPPAGRGASLNPCAAGLVSAAGEAASARRWRPPAPPPPQTSTLPSRPPFSRPPSLCSRNARAAPPTAPRSPSPQPAEGGGGSARTAARRGGGTHARIVTSSLVAVATPSHRSGSTTSYQQRTSWGLVPSLRVRVATALREGEPSRCPRPGTRRPGARLGLGEGPGRLETPAHGPGRRPSRSARGRVPKARGQGPGAARVRLTRRDLRLRTRLGPDVVLTPFREGERGNVPSTWRRAFR